MSRSSGRWRSGRLRTMLAGAVAVIAVTAGTVLGGAATAGADPATPTPIVEPVAADDLAALLTQAAATSPEAFDAVSHLLARAAADQIAAALDIPALGVTVPKPFLYPAPTLGCGVAGNPVTLTVSTAQGGPNFPIPPWVKDNQLRFQAIPGYLGIPESSGLTVAWLNVNTLAGGIVPLDEKLPLLDTPTLSTVVDTGNGKVLAALFGTVDYIGGEKCYVLPTVGAFDS
ncbi:hypothetical protein ABH922_002096 [Rhodococcus sp. 27YEA15]|uniref:hypothetical protein n=1 Tax=Rhodococcus sp. 27YEA15 TaxID=3156259 RepID=UPI003C79B526